MAGFAPESKAFAVPHEVRTGDRIALALREPEMAREDLKAMLGSLGSPPSLGLYFNCCARGANFFGVAGLEAEGDAASDYMLQAPGLGVNALGGAMGAQTTMRGQDLQGRMAEMSNYLSREGSNAALEMQQRNLDFDRDRMDQDRYLQELMLEYGGY